MSFLDNPVISSLVQATGLADVFAAPKVATSKPNIPVASSRNRPYIPRNEMGSAGSMGGGVRPGSNTATTPGVMDPQTLQDPNVQNLLGQYGVTPPTTPPNGNLFVHNPDAFQRHPVAAGLLERGLGALSNYHPGYNFLTSFTGQLQGNREYEGERAAQENAQVMAPVQQAEQIQRLQQGSDQHATAMNDIKYKQGILDHYGKEDSIKDDRAQVHRPYNMGGVPYIYDPAQDNYIQDPSFKPVSKPGTVRALMEDKGMKDLTDKYGGNINDVPLDEVMALHQKILAGESDAKAHGAAGNIKLKAGLKGAGGGTAGGFTAQQKAQAKIISDQLKQKDKEINQLQHPSSASPFAYDDAGARYLPGSPTHKAILAKKQQERDTLAQSQQNLLTGTSKPSQTFTPPPADGADGYWDPIQKKSVYYKK